MRTFIEISEIIKESISKMPMPVDPSGLYDPIRYILEDGGKRLRPLLLMMAAEAFGKDPAEVVNQAIGIEVFHNFTLLHDDIMDRAPIRRGRPTVHCKWNDNTAILSGDAMVILAYKFLTSGLKSGEVLQIFNKAALEVCEGQQLDMDFESMDNVPLEDYINMIRLKTAVLLACALEIGAKLAGADAESCESIYKFGEQLGLAFQIQDDLLDTYGDSKVFGKEIGGDIREGKKTYLRIQAFLKSNEDERKILLKSRDYNTIRNLYDKLKVREDAEKAIESYFSTATSYLDKCNGFNKDRILEFANILVKRNK